MIPINAMYKDVDYFICTEEDVPEEPEERNEEKRNPRRSIYMPN